MARPRVARRSSKTDERESCNNVLGLDDVRGLHEQRPQVLVAALRDLAEDRAIPSGLLLGHEPQPSAEVASLLEAGAIADRRHHGTRDDRADARHGHQALATLIL